MLDEIPDALDIKKKVVKKKIVKRIVKKKNVDGSEAPS
jgi:hypothetical protein